MTQTEHPTYDYLVIGSGFGGSVSAMRLAEKGYRVLVLERGRRFRDEDFARTNWDVPNYLWLPALRCYGIQAMTLLKDVLVLGGAGVGGGSLVYANVLMEPGPEMFEAPAWRHLADWQAVLAPHYATAKRMLGVTQNPCLWPADHVLEDVSAEMGRGATFRPTDVGVFFGEPGREGETVPDPYFDGEGPARAGCIECGGCMVGCRYNAKNTLVKNYLYFAEKSGAHIEAETTVIAIQPLLEGEPDGARYAVTTRRSTAWPGGERTFRACNVVVSAGVLGTLKLLYHCRDTLGTLPAISARLGDRVRTNSEALLGITARDDSADYSEGVAITSLFHADDVTAIEPVRYPPGSSFMRLMAAPLVASGGRGVVWRWLRVLAEGLRHPLDLLRSKLLRRWPERTTILLVMQTEDNLMRLSYGRGLLHPLRAGLRSEPDPDHPIEAEIPIGHAVTRAFADRIDGIPQGAVNESLLDIPTTAHILGGVPMGHDAEEGVIGLDCQVHGYPGLYVVDGSIVPANPGINPSLTITALAEYAMSQVPAAG